MTLIKDRIKLEKHRELLANPKVQAILRTIRYAEGTGDEGYGTRVGGEKFADLSKKPGKKTYIKSIGDYSTAEGAYQFLNKTWEGVSKKLGLTDFSPESQDIAAVDLIIQRGALNDILNDNFKGAITKLSPEWASLPKNGGGSTYKNQKAKNIEQLEEVFYGSNSTVANRPNQKQEIIIPTISNFDVSTESPTFVPEETKTEVVENKNIQDLQQKENEKNFLEDLYAQQEQPQYVDSQNEVSQQQIPKTNFANVYNQVSQFIDQPTTSQQGGVIQDNQGQYNHPGEITQINASNITMKNVNYPVLGIADTGEKKMMFPNKDYNFVGAKTVTEYPQLTEEEKAFLKEIKNYGQK